MRLFILLLALLGVHAEEGSGEDPDDDDDTETGLYIGIPSAVVLLAIVGVAIWHRRARKVNFSMALREII